MRKILSLPLYYGDEVENARKYDWENNSKLFKQRL